MPASDSELAPMENNHAVEEKKGTLLDGPFSPPPASAPSSSPPFPATTRPNFTSETTLESRAVSMASNDCSSVLSSPAEGSPAKPAATSTSAFEGTLETSPATSCVISASCSPKSTGSSLINLSESTPYTYILPSATFGDPDAVGGFPSVLTFKGVSVTLENNSVWKQFCSCGTEMILTKLGRRMFPYCRYRLSGLDPNRQYSLVLSIVPVGQYRYRWNTSKWEVNGPAEHQAQSLIRAFSHHYSPCQGSEWMSGLVSFYKLKLTNNILDLHGHLILHSMHRYIPRLHIIPVPEGGTPTHNQPVVMGPESMTFTFPQTEFMAVTTYQNFRITQLKINHNPFAKGFREDGNNPRLNRNLTDAQPVKRTDAEPSALRPAEPSEHEEEVVDLSTKSNSDAAPASTTPETRLVLKPIMSNPASTGESYVPCMRGKHALGELVLVQKSVEPKEENATCAAPEEQQGSKRLKVSPFPKASSVTPSSSTSTPGSSPRFRKKRRRGMNRRWANSRGKLWKAAPAAPTVVHSPSLSVAMQPELDEVEGLLFVSFTSKEALEAHVNDRTANTSSSESPVSLTTPVQSEQTVEVNPETVEEKMSRMESVLLSDLRVLKHRQVIHPVLQEVGLKLSSLDPTLSIDLQYLGVCLPLPPPNLPEQSGTAAPSPADEGLPFVSRTGKTSDVTKIKGWKNKFIKGKETSPSHCEEGLPKNLSAFCSNMLDEYLESEAQQISERAAAFSTDPEGSVAYQLPVKSSSYVRTLDSALKHRNAASSFTVGDNKPCPLSHKRAPYAAPAVAAPPPASPAAPSPENAQSRYQSTSSHARPGAASGSSNSSDVSQRPSTCQPAVSPRAAASVVPSHGMAHKPSGLTKMQLKLLQMEVEAVKQGLSRTRLTEERLTLALSVILTKQMLHSQLKVARFPRSSAKAPECGQDFCRLGCVCSSLQSVNRDSAHCRRPDCMFGCTCFKRKITKQANAGESEEQSHPVYSMTNMEHDVQPHPGSRALRLWNRSVLGEDPEPLFTPKTAPAPVVTPKVLKRSVPRPTQLIREEDKDPVYKYLESLMTCARVREFNKNSPPEVPVDTKIADFIFALNNTAKPQKHSSLSEKPNSAVPNGPKAVSSGEKPSQETLSREIGAKKQIQIQSVCQWKKDGKLVLERLCERMKQNRLHQRFYIGPYCISPVTKIFMRKPSGSIVTYRVQISKPSKTSDYDEDESDECDEERHVGESCDGNSDAEEDEQIGEPEKLFGVTPFLSGVLPAGRLRARKKPAGCIAHGLIKVNGKYYNQARLLLGNVGSLHPANRLAAYVTGRLNVHSFDKTSRAPESTRKACRAKAPDAAAALLTTKAQPPAWLSAPDAQSKESINPVQLFFPMHQHTSTSQNSWTFQNSSTSSPVSLTVSPSLKNPSFLRRRGTCSFRICPPSSQAAGDQKPPGVSLPGGFTLIQLPNHGTTGAAQQSVPLNATNVSGAADIPDQQDGASNLRQLAEQWLGSNSFSKVKTLLSGKLAEAGASPGLTGEKMLPDENEANSGPTPDQEEPNMDAASEDLSSDFSDYDEDDDMIDIETVEETEQEETITKLKEEALTTLQNSQDCRDDVGSLKYQEDDDNLKDKKKRKNHTAIERQRRSEQRLLFTRLQVVLKSHHRTPRLHLLSLATKEIRHLVKTSRCLEEKKERLIRLQSIYVKKLSLLAGKPESLIEDKLKEICERQKRREMKWKPIFSQLLERKAALLQASEPQPTPTPTPTPLLPPTHRPPPQPILPASVQSSLLKLLSLLPASKRQEKAPAQHSHTQNPQRLLLPFGTPPKWPESQQGKPGATWPNLKLPRNRAALGEPDQAAASHSQTKDQSKASWNPPTLEVTVAQDDVPPESSSDSPNQPKERPILPLASVPLIRSKTGRIILPSCLKPLGQGVYTLMVMKPKQDGEMDDSAAALESSTVDASRSSEQNISAHQRSDPEAGHVSEDKTASSDADPKCSGAASHFSGLTVFSKSFVMPSLDLKAEGNQAGIRLCFKPVRQLPAPAVSTSNITPTPSRPRGRPRKTHAKPARGDGKEDEEGDHEESDEQTEVQTGDGPGVSGRVSGGSAPEKRRRGRPPKNKTRGRSPSNSKEDSPVRFSAGCLKKRDPKTLMRPLTRGSLGKDFPSEKKRSWLDVERALEPELEF